MIWLRQVNNSSRMTIKFNSNQKCRYPSIVILIGIWAQAKGRKGGTTGRETLRQKQERVAGRRDERRSMVGGGGGKSPGGRRTNLGEEVGSRCYSKSEVI